MAEETERSEEIGNGVDAVEASPMASPAEIVSAEIPSIESPVEMAIPAVLLEGVSAESPEPSKEKPERKGEWKPRTHLGLMVKEGKVTSMGQVFAHGYRIQEAEIVDALLSPLEEDLLLIGQAKGKFGGGQRRVFRQTQKKTREGNRIHFLTFALIGNRDGYIGGAGGKSKETVPARDKAKRNARLALMQVRRGCGSWECNCRQPHSIPFAAEGRCGSVRIRLMPAPKGKGLCVEKECAKILSFAGIKDIWSKTSGQTGTKLNLIFALFDALRQLSQQKVQPELREQLGVVDGSIAEPGSASLSLAELIPPAEISSDSSSPSSSSYSTESHSTKGREMPIVAGVA